MLTIIELITDCETEFDNQKIRQLISENGSRLILKKKIKRKSRCMLIESKLEKVWWKHARDTAYYIYNKVVNSQNEIPPFTQMCGTRESLSHLRIFDS